MAARSSQNSSVRIVGGGTLRLCAPPGLLDLARCRAAASTVFLYASWRASRCWAMTVHKHRRGTSLLVMLQASILPCHGFTYSPYGLGTSHAGSQQAARQSSFAALQPRPLKATAVISRNTLSSLSLSEEPGAFGDPFADEVCCWAGGPAWCGVFFLLQFLPAVPSRAQT